MLFGPVQMAASTSSTPSVLLNTGAQMPLLGLGTYRLTGAEDVCCAVDAALAAGYRAFDTAAVYRNEADLGQALKKLLPKYKLSREDVFITRLVLSNDLLKITVSILCFCCFGLVCHTSFCFMPKCMFKRSF